MNAAMFDLRHEGGSARLTLDRPAARNAIPVSGWPALAAAAESAVEAGARVLVVAGAGSAFCAGADLSEFEALLGDETAAGRLRQAMADAFSRIAALPIPTIALIEGACFGAGVALAMACDLRVAGRRARFAITPAKLGISYPQQDVHRLVSLIGPGQAARLLLAAEAIGVDEAATIGLVDICSDEAEARVQALAAAMLANSAASLKSLKRAVALAAVDVAQDPEQDRIFDALLASDELSSRLRVLRGR